MTVQGGASFGDALRAAIRAARSTQAEVARGVNTDPGQVSRWVNSKAIPHIETVARIEALLGADLTDAFKASTPDIELYVSTPIAGLANSDLARHHDEVERVLAVARQHVNNLFWPGQSIRSLTELAAPDLATERNLQILAGCPAYLYLQFADIVHPSGALIEFGFALGRRLKTTLIIQSGLANPYMLNGFGAVAATLKFLPKARIYYVASVEEAVALITRNGRELLGLS